MAGEPLQRNAANQAGTHFHKLLVRLCFKMVSEDVCQTSTNTPVWKTLGLWASGPLKSKPHPDVGKGTLDYHCSCYPCYCRFADNPSACCSDSQPNNMELSTKIAIAINTMMLFHFQTDSPNSSSQFDTEPLRHIPTFQCAWAGVSKNRQDV